MSSEIDLTIVIIFILLTAYFTLKGRLKYVIYLIPFALSLHFFVEIGTRWTLWKVFPITYWICYFIRKTAQKKPLFTKFMPKEYIFLIIFLIFNSIAQYLRISIFPPPYYSFLPSLPFFQSFQIRTIIQFISYIVKVSYFLIPLSIIYEEKVYLKTFLYSYLFVTTILCIYGLYQIIAYKYNLPFRGIIYSEFKQGLGMFNIAGRDVFRVNSLANEPKQFALFLLPSIGILIFLTSFRKYTGNSLISGAWNLFFHLLMIIVAFSTAGFIGLGFGLFLELIYFWRILRLRRMYLLTTLILSFSLVFLFIFYYYRGIEVFFTAFKFEVFKDPQPFLERMEGRMLFYLLKHPQNLIFGFGPGNYNFYIPTSVGSWGVSPIISSAVNMLVDNGIIGLFLILVLFYKILRKEILSALNVSKREEIYYLKHCLIIGTLLSFSGFLALDGLPLFFYFLGIIWSDLYIFRNQIHSISIKPSSIQDQIPY